MSTCGGLEGTAHVPCSGSGRSMGVVGEGSTPRQIRSFALNLYTGRANTAADEHVGSDFGVWGVCARTAWLRWLELIKDLYVLHAPVAFQTWPH